MFTLRSPQAVKSCAYTDNSQLPSLTTTFTISLFIMAVATKLENEVQKPRSVIHEHDQVVDGKSGGLPIIAVGDLYQKADRRKQEARKATLLREFEQVLEGIADVEVEEREHVMTRDLDKYDEEYVCPSSRNSHLRIDLRVMRPNSYCHVI